jgi:predicted dehydrogenase
MSDTYNRRGFFRNSGLAAFTQGAQPDARPLRVGMVGVGDRGTYHMDVLLGMDSVEVKALCDINPEYLYRAKRWVEQAGKPSPALYSGPADYLKLVERDDLDLVVTATPWQLHAPVCVAAMKAGKHACTEVPAALTVEQCWELVEASEKSGKHCTMLEQVNYSEEELAILNMAQQGLFGEIVHATGGYVHDLRLVKFDPEREPWRLQHSIDRNGNLYPTHPTGPISWWLNINRGDRFESMVSVSSKAVMINDYASRFYGPKHPYASIKAAQGDVNTSILRTADGKTVVLHFDTNTPHPQTGEILLQGTNGLYSGNERTIYVEGRSPEEHKWEPVKKYIDEFRHPLYQKIDPKKFKSARGHGGGTDTHVMWACILDALMKGRRPDMDVYDAVTWSVISPLSEQSVATRSKPVQFPDFTRGKWKTNPPVKLV